MSTRLSKPQGSRSRECQLWVKADISGSLHQVQSYFKIGHR